MAPDEERDAGRRALFLGLVNVLAASLAAAGQWASWRTENEVGLAIAAPDGWRVLAVFGANLAPAGLAVVWCLSIARVWRYGWRRRLLLAGLAAALSTLVRLELLATLRYSEPDVWFVVVEVGFGLLAVVLAVSLALYDHDVGAELRAAEERRRAEAERAEEARRAAEDADLKVRRDVSRRLHGSIQQRLVILAHRLERVAGSTGPAADELHALAEELDEIRERDVRALSHSLLPAGVDIGMREALQLALARLPPSVWTSVTLEPSIAERLGDADRPRMAVADRLVVLDVVEEAVTNAVRHGRASAIEIRLGIDLTGHPSLTIAVDDDGAGLAGVPVPSGLARLRETLERRGGTLELGARPEGGARLSARLPLTLGRRAAS